ncbi:PTS system sorbose-specific iic component [Anaerococcus lactolyticus ATCC 51172]|uniref:PTS system sorbose-specific iic component n=1 Tax=Anaerococcus lactolyticus ATCC 51172 TaxID=525254 RepID=C2BGY3_9FIRM|nr:PTS sugar transporter subunit IIC [Anaerococcus lactolyticus]EEI85846.1 PTS system sorbose-specific iic component [Anaerococcus lactolyticus ATCC 51172]
MFIQALLIGIVSGIGILDGRILGQLMLDRPLVLGALVGLILGDLKSGIIIGAQLELIWMGVAGIGAATPPDIVTGGVLGTAFAIISGKGAEIALAVAVPISVLAQSLGVLVRIINAYYSHKADRYAIERNYKGLALCMWIPAFLFFLSTFLPTFLAMLLGAEHVSAFINSIPKVVLDGLSVAGKLLPAIGFALLMDMLWSKKVAPFFFVGFLLASYFNVNITGIALIIAAIAMIIEFYIKDDKQAVVVSDNLVEGDIDFE